MFAEKSYAADKIFTRPPVAAVAPNINSGLILKLAQYKYIWQALFDTNLFLSGFNMICKQMFVPFIDTYFFSSKYIFAGSLSGLAALQIFVSFIDIYFSSSKYIFVSVPLVWWQALFYTNLSFLVRKLSCKFLPPAAKAFLLPGM